MAVMVLDRSDERIRRIARIYTVEEVDSITSSSSSEKTAQASLAVVNSSTSVVAQDYYDMGFLISEALDSFLFQNSDGLLKSIGVTGQTIVNVVRVRRGSVIGDSTTQFDVSNPAGNTYRYTYDGTGTDPGISDSDSSFRIGDEVTIIATNMASGNEGKFTLTGVGDNYFEVTNVSGVVESNKTIGTGSITPLRHRDMLSTGITFTTSDTAESTSVDTNYYTVQEGDYIYPTVSEIHSGTAPRGLWINLYFLKSS